MLTFPPTCPHQPAHQPDTQLTYTPTPTHTPTGALLQALPQVPHQEGVEHISTHTPLSPNTCRRPSPATRTPKLPHTHSPIPTQAPFSKRYLKYLTKKYLKKQQLRDWMRVVAVNKVTYEIKYFDINQDEEEEDEE